MKSDLSFVVILARFYVRLNHPSRPHSLGATARSRSCRSRRSRNYRIPVNDRLRRVLVGVGGTDLSDSREALFIRDLSVVHLHHRL